MKDGLRTEILRETCNEVTIRRWASNSRLADLKRPFCIFIYYYHNAEKKINVLLCLTAQHVCSIEGIHRVAAELGFASYELDMFLTDNQGEIWCAVFEMLDNWRNKQLTRVDDMLKLQERLLELLEPSVQEDVIKKLHLLTTGKAINVKIVFTRKKSALITHHSSLSTHQKDSLIHRYRYVAVDLPRTSSCL